MSSSSSESEHEDDTSVGSIFVVEEFIDDDDLEAMVEMAHGYQRARERFRQLKENDPTLTGMVIGDVADYVRTITDWEQLGGIIANNTAK